MNYTGSLQDLRFGGRHLNSKTRLCAISAHKQCSAHPVLILTIQNIVGDPHMPHSDVVKIGRSYLLGRCCRRKLWNGPPASPTLPSRLTYCQERYGARPVALEQTFDLSLCYFLPLQPTCIETSMSRLDSSRPDSMFPRNDKNDENVGPKDSDSDLFVNVVSENRKCPMSPK